MISVIGAGPAGSFYAFKEKHDEAHIFEEHPEVGNPIACTGILTDAVDQFINIPDDLVISKIRQFKLIAPYGQSVYVDLKKTNRVLHRARFDQFLAEKAVDAGAHLHLSEKFIGYKKKAKGLYMVKTDKGEYETSQIVGADGPYSAVAQAAGIYGKREFVRGWQARCEFPDLEEGVTEVHLGLGEFSWVVPEDDKIARVGVIGADTHLIKRDYHKLLGASKIIEDQSGIIPLYNPKQKLRKGKEDIFLLGDAATHVKATTYGGIIYGMIAGNYLAQDKESFIRNVNKKLAKDLWISLKMREMMNSMTEEQANEMLEIFQKKENNAILAAGDRNFPSRFLVQLLMKEAKLWKLGFGIFKNQMFGK
ncbi:TPA: NAD(P)/FAD-dependent oxidoreductase [Candidatus Woesearchaeota archaeon]|nr:NAD(P)/FAD-dependent oxidoreductase [Candidatus Woesearchaeota archaeon]